jgi:hypothetical protein
MFDILDILLVAVLFDQQARFPEIMSRHPWEEVMCDLKMQTSVYELDILGTDYVHRCPQLTRREGFGGAEVVSRTGEMG